MKTIKIDITQVKEYSLSMLSENISYILNSYYGEVFSDNTNQRIERDINTCIDNTVMHLISEYKIYPDFESEFKNFLKSIIKINIK